MPFDANLTPNEIHPWVAQGLERVRFGVSIFPQPIKWNHFRELVLMMEAQGIDAYWAYDHPRDRTDCWTSLAALAATTTTIRLGTAVDCVYYRSPYMLARQAADVDRISGGRLILGLGAGHVEPEFAEMGIHFPPLPVRQQGLEETVQILRGLWTGEPFQLAGEQWSVDSEGTFLPPVQEPYIPFLIAGGGEKVTLRQVAQYADASNMGAHSSIGSAMNRKDVERKFQKLDSYCRQFARSPEAVLRSQFTMPLILAADAAALERKMAAITAQYGQDKLDWCGEALFAATVADAITFYRELADLGFQYFIANILDGDDETVELLGSEVMPAFA